MSELLQQGADVKHEDKLVSFTCNKKASLHIWKSNLCDE